MGSLKTGTKYIYEHADGITYAREFGAPHSERFEIGRTAEKQSLIDDLRENQLWGNIRRAAKTNTLLREALERVIMIYHLSEQDGKK
jgi:hypothetical protein